MLRTPCLMLLVVVSAFGQKTDRDVLAKAYKALESKDYPLAADLFERAVKANPRNANAHANLGFALAMLRRYPEALAASEKAIALDRRVPFYHVNAAAYASNLFEFTKLKKYGESALAFGPSKLGESNTKLVKELLRDLQPRLYTVTWTLDPKPALGEGGRGAGPFYFPLPATDLPYQSATYTVKGASSSREVTRDGVRLLKFEADGPVELTAAVTVRFHDYRPKVKSEPAGTYPDEARAYLDPMGEKVKVIAAKVKADSPRETVANLLAWIQGNLKYVAPSTFTTVDEVLKRGNGDCGAYSAVFVAVCRASGIPAREVWGVAKGNAPLVPEGHLASHVWAEVYLSGLGWVPVEPQNLNGLGHQPTGYVRLSHFVTARHDWPLAMKAALSGNTFGKPAETPKYDEKSLEK
jgi:hypothetical protein